MSFVQSVESAAPPPAELEKKADKPIRLVSLRTELTHLDANAEEELWLCLAAIYGQRLQADTSLHLPAVHVDAVLTKA